MAAPSDILRTGTGSDAPWLVGPADGGVATEELPSSMAGTSEPVGGTATVGGEVGDGSDDGVGALGSDVRADSSGTAGAEFGAAVGLACALSSAGCASSGRDTVASSKRASRPGRLRARPQISRWAWEGMGSRSVSAAGNFANRPLASGRMGHGGRARISHWPWPRESVAAPGHRAGPGSLPRSCFATRRWCSSFRRAFATRRARESWPPWRPRDPGCVP